MEMQILEVELGKTNIRSGYRVAVLLHTEPPSWTVTAG